MAKRTSLLDSFREIVTKKIFVEFRNSRNFSIFGASGVRNDGNIGFDGYIGTWILRIYRIYRRYIRGYFYMNIDILEIKKNTLKFMEILSKCVKMTLIIQSIH